MANTNPTETEITAIRNAAWFGFLETNGTFLGSTFDPDYSIEETYFLLAGQTYLVAATLTPVDTYLVLDVIKLPAGYLLPTF